MKIYSINEWDPLKIVILGRFFEEYFFNIDFTFKLFFKDSLGYLPHGERIQIKKKYIEELNEDLEEFKNTLKKLGIQVLRPKTISKIHRIQTPIYKTELMPPLNVRDQTLILGDTIIETAPFIRSRYFENDFFKNIFYEAFLDGAKWIKMPIPIMDENSYDKEYINEKTKIRIEFFKTNNEDNVNIVDKNPNKFNYNLNHFEMMIDAAQFIRFGKNILVNVSNRNHYLGYLWFKRQFPEYNFHILTHWADNHIDSFIVPLCEGVLLLRNKQYLDVLPEFLKDWKIIYPPKPKESIFPKYDKNDPILTTPYIDMNVLSIDGKKIICNSMFPELCDLLYKESFDPIPVRHRHRRIFAGGFHCFTLDLLRENK